jgi:adenylate cyclase class 2
MIEVELKFRLHDPEDLLMRLIARGAVRSFDSLQVDLYFDHPVRRFAATDEALRLRWDQRDGLVITYKGPRLDDKSKTREEIELGIVGSEPTLNSATVLLKRLGFREVRRVSKRRTTYLARDELRDVTISIDEVDAIGLFVELEAIADESDWQAAREALERLARGLGLGPLSSERRSYLELLLESDRARASVD